MEGLKVPFAYDAHGKLVDTKTAKKKTDYKCSCGGVVRLRGGEKVQDHFYHFDDSTCSYESAIHKAYKNVFKEVKEIRCPVGFLEGMLGDASSASSCTTQRSSSEQM